MSAFLPSEYKVLFLQVAKGDKQAFRAIFVLYKKSFYSVAFKRLTTTRGRQYPLLRPAGSRVWLNAALSITYPSVFTGNTRKVEITGEAYFGMAPFSDKRDREVLPMILNSCLFQKGHSFKYR